MRSLEESVISPGDHIAQLLILPSLHNKFPAKETIRGKRGFRSTGVDMVYLSLELDKQPMLGLKIEGKHFRGLLDTGADRSIIRKEEWPARWPLQSSSQLLQGLGYANIPEVSAKELVWVC